MRWARVTRTVIAPIAVVLLGFAAGACGSESASTGKSSQADLDSAKKAVEAAEAPVKFEPPGEPFEMSKNKGGTVWFIAPSLQIPFVVAISEGAKEAASKAGMTLKVFDGEGKADRFNQGVSLAVSQKAAGIILQAIPPEIVSGTLSEAKAVGIPVIDTFNRGPDAALPDGIAGQVTLDYAQTGRTLANFIAVDSGGKATVGVVTWGIYTIYKEMVPAFEQQLKEVCGGCSVATVKDVSPTAPATELQNLTTTMLQQNPSINYLAPVADNIATGMLPAVEARSDSKVKIVSSDANPPNLKNVEAGHIQVADVSTPPLDAIGWAQIDQLGRIMAGGKPAAANANLPTQLFTEKNIPPASDRFPGYADFQAQYLKEWGL